jgi:hypothetical protein
MSALVTVENISSVVAYESTCKWLALCEDRAECKDISDKAKALEELAKRIKNTDAERRACNIRLVAERRYGELLKELARSTPSDAGAKGNAAQGKNAPPDAGSASPYAQALANDNISTQAASRYQALADIPKADFEDALRGPEKPSVRALIENARAPQHKMPADALWFWGRLRDFERDGFFDKRIEDLLEPMTDSMQADVLRILPLMADFFNLSVETINESV